MFCPQCGAKIASDRRRFCTHCRFPVGSVKEFIETEVTKFQAEDEKKASRRLQPALNLAAASASPLQSAQNASDVEPNTNRFKEAEMAITFSVTENTTETLKNKHSSTQP